MFFKKKFPLAPNFLEPFQFSSPTEELEAGGLLFFVFFCTLLLFPFQQFQGLGVIFLVLLVLFALIVKIDWGMYALGIFGFFHGWEVALANYQITRNISFLNSINAPVVDFLAAIILPCVLFGIFLGRWKKKYSWRHLIVPTFLYVCFVALGWWSALSTHEMQTSESLRFLFRPLIFNFIAFIVLPHLLIQKKVILTRLLKIWFWLGVCIALFGLSSLFVIPSSGWVRIQPYGIGSFAPLGINHNLIAEVLIALFPIGLWHMWEERKQPGIQGSQEKNLFSWYFVGTGLILLVALGTLSRAAWITLAVEIVALILLFREQFQILFKKVKHLFLPLSILGLVFIMYMLVFLTSHIVSSSDTSRIEVTKIVLFYAKRSLWIGHGPGSFVPIIEDTYVHTVEFGAALDAHGFIQKILLEQGILGLTFFLLFLGSIVWVLFVEQKRQRETLSKLLFVMALGAMVFQIFNTSYFNSVMWLPLGVALAAVSVMKNSSQ